MRRPRLTHVYSIDHIAIMIGESLELMEVLTTLTDCGIESLQEFLADVRTWNGGIRQLPIDQQCDPAVIKRIMAKEQKP